MQTPRDLMNRQGGRIAFLMCLMLGFSLWALVFREVPEANQNALLVVIGILAGAVGTVVNFYFSSTSTSKQQQGIIADQASTIKTAQDVLAPLAAPAVVLEPGQSAVVAASPENPTNGEDSEPKQG